MSVDTAQKRMSAMSLSSPWRGPLVAAAEASFTRGNRQAALFMYSGIPDSAAGPDMISIHIINASFSSPSVSSALFSSPRVQTVMGAFVSPSVTGVEWLN